MDMCVSARSRQRRVMRSCGPAFAASEELHESLSQRLTVLEGRIESELGSLEDAAEAKVQSRLARLEQLAETWESGGRNHQMRLSALETCSEESRRVNSLFEPMQRELMELRASTRATHADMQLIRKELLEADLKQAVPTVDAALQEAKIHLEERLQQQSAVMRQLLSAHHALTVEHQVLGEEYRALASSVTELLTKAKTDSPCPLQELSHRQPLDLVDDPALVVHVIEAQEDFQSKPFVGGDSTPSQTTSDELPTRGSLQLTKSEVVAQTKLHATYALADSAWESMVLAGVHGVGTPATILLLITLMLNIVIQLFFCVMATNCFTEKSIPEDAVAAARSWRLTEAHALDRMDKTGWVSLATRVCSHDSSLVIANGQLGMLETINSFFEPVQILIFWELPIGRSLSVLVLFVWVLTVSEEFLSISAFVNAMLTLERGPTSIVFENDRYRLERISRRRFLGCMFVTLIRLVVACTLTVIGGLWQARTAELRELVLNAAALAFVLELDELVYKTLVPRTVREIQGSLVPLRMQPLMWRQLAPGTPMVLLGSAVFIVLFTVYEVFPMEDRMLEIKREMCDRGTTRFVVETNPTFGYAVVGQTRESPTDAMTLQDVLVDDTLLKFVTAEFIDMNISNEVVESATTTGYFVLERWDFINEVVRGLDSVSQVICLDTLNLEVSPGEQRPANMALLKALQYATGELEGRSCQAFEAWCRDFNIGKLVRFGCSLTCGCPVPTSGLAQRAGCIGACMGEFQRNLDYASCQDWTQAQLQATPHFADFLDAIKVESHGAFHFEQEKLLAHGCAALQRQNYLLAFSPESALWEPDVLCGREIGATFAAEQPVTQSLRAFCPVSCSCSLGMSKDCPRACARGPGTVSASPLIAGICPGGSLLEDVAVPWPLAPTALTCGEYDRHCRTGAFDCLFKAPRQAYEALCCNSLALQAADAEGCASGLCPDSPLTANTEIDVLSRATCASLDFAMTQTLHPPYFTDPECVVVRHQYQQCCGPVRL